MSLSFSRLPARRHRSEPVTMKMSRLALAAFVTAAIAGGPAFADGNLDKGRSTFNLCRACHSLEAGKNLIGPSLHGLFGRKAGTAPGYNYSGAMKKADIVWTAKTLDQYLADPRKMIPGNKMAFPGLKTEQQREDLIAYLSQATK
jgi:cytochrome c2